MPIVQGIDGSMLLNAFRQGREDRANVDERALQKMYQQRQMEIQDKQLQRQDKKDAKQDKIDETYANIFGEAQPAGDGSAPPAAQSGAFRPDPEKLRALMALGPDGVAAAKALQSMSADQIEAAQKASVQAMEIKGRVINAIRALPPEQRDAEYQAQKAELAAQGVDVSKLAPAWDEKYADMLIRQSMEAAKAIGLDREAEKFAETVRHNKQAEGVAAGNLAVAKGRLGVSQGALGLAKSRAAKGGDAADDSDLSYLMDN